MFMEGHSKALYGIDFSPNGYVTILCYRIFHYKGMKSREMTGLSDIYGSDTILAIFPTQLSCGIASHRWGMIAFCLE